METQTNQPQGKSLAKNVLGILLIGGLFLAVAYLIWRPKSSPTTELKIPSDSGIATVMLSDLRHFKQVFAYKFGEGSSAVYQVLFEQDSFKSETVRDTIKKKDTTLLRLQMSLDGTPLQKRSFPYLTEPDIKFWISVKPKK